MQHISKLEKVEIRAVIKYLCMKGMPSKEIHEAFMKNLGRESPSYSTVKKWTTKFKKGRERALRLTDGLAPKNATPDENVKVVHTLVLCDRRLDLRSITSEVGKSLGAVQSILTEHPRYVKSFGCRQC